MVKATVWGIADGIVAINLLASQFAALPADANE